MSLLPLALSLLIAAGVILFGLRYTQATAPLDYHKAIIEGDGGHLHDGLALVLTALYRGMGGALLALGLCIAVVALTARAEDTLMVGLLVGGAGALAGLPVTLAAHKAETQSGQRTPWRGSAILTALSLLTCVTAAVA